MSPAIGGPVLLVYPPVSKPGEAPAGIARLAGALRAHDIRCLTLDANLEALIDLGARSKSGADRWTDRSVRGFARNIEALRNPLTYKTFDRYKRAVSDINRVLEVSGRKDGVRISVSDYEQNELSPVRSTDLWRAFENPDKNPFHGYLTARLRGLIESEGPAIVGISLSFLSQALCAFSILGFLRREFPSLSLVLGGSLITSWMRNPNWVNPFEGMVDHLIAGPGEQALISLVRSGYGQAWAPDATPVRSIPDYGSLPTQDYLSPTAVLPYSASGGCYWNRCSFCPERAEQTPYTPSGDEDVLDDLHALSSRMKPGLIHLLDNAISPSLMKSFCATPLPAPWYGFARVTRELAEPEFCRALRQSGCVMLKLGVESGDQDVIDREQKGMRVREAAAALRALKSSGISTYVYLLFGTPAENIAAARRTLAFTRANAEFIDFLNLAIFNMPIFGPEARELGTNPHYYGDLSLYTAFDHPLGWERRRVRLFLEGEFKKEKAIATILRRDPPGFTSTHAPFFR